jgi:hypothetical protein
MALTLAPADDIADATAIAAHLADAERRLKEALLAGARTHDLHAEIATLRATASRIAAADADAQAEAEAQAAQARQAHVAEVAGRYTADIARRLADRMAALAPPSFSIPTPTRIPPR